MEREREKDRDMKREDGRSRDGSAKINASLSFDAIYG